MPLMEDSANNTLVSVYQVGSMEEASILIGSLGAEGIDATMKYQTVGSGAIPLSVSGLGTVDILVRQEDAERATRILVADLSDTITDDYDEEDRP
jgi:hypothetical protein